MRLTCVDCEPELAARAAGELDAQIADAVDAHLAACAHCRAELARELALRAGLGALPLVPCPPDVSARVLEAVERDAAGTRSRRRARWGFAGLTVTAAAALAAWLLLGFPTARNGSPAGGPTVARTPERSLPAAPPAVARDVTTPDGTRYTAEQITAARRDLIRTMTLTANLLDRAGRRTLADVFSTHLPAAVAGSLRPLDDATRGG